MTRACECFVQFARGDVSPPRHLFIPTIVYCPLHAAAERLATALEEQGRRPGSAPEDWCCCGHEAMFNGTPESGHADDCGRARALLREIGR